MVRAAVTRFLVASWCHALPSEQLHRNIADAVFADAPVKHLDDVLVLRLACNAGLGDEPSLDILVKGEVWMQNFYCSLSPLDRRMFSLVDRAKSSLSEHSGKRPVA